MRVLGAVFAFVAGLVVLDNKAVAIPIATQSYVVNFTGFCEVDCSNTATGVLTLQNYALGDFLSSSNFVSFSYSSNVLSFTISSGDSLLSVGGSIAGNGANSVGIGNADHFFESQNSGLWCVDNSAFCNQLQNDDAGTEGTWEVSARGVPEPGSFALAAIGMAGLLLVATRRSTGVLPRRY
jgi:hypothetical protein